jgi:uncharacterized membrane protein
MIMATFLLCLGIVSLIPFISGLLGSSRRIPYLMAVAITFGLIYLAAVTFSNSLKYQDAYQLLLIDIGTIALGAVELLLAFLLAHWLGARFRAGLVWTINRLRGA